MQLLGHSSLVTGYILNIPTSVSRIIPLSSFAKRIKCLSYHLATSVTQHGDDIGTPSNLDILLARGTFEGLKRIVDQAEKDAFKTMQGGNWVWLSWTRLFVHIGILFTGGMTLYMFCHLKRRSNVKTIKIN